MVRYGHGASSGASAPIAPLVATDRPSSRIAPRLTGPEPANETLTNARMTTNGSALTAIRVIRVSVEECAESCQVNTAAVIITVTASRPSRSHSPRVRPVAGTRTTHQPARKTPDPYSTSVVPLIS